MVCDYIIFNITSRVIEGKDLNVNKIIEETSVLRKLSIDKESLNRISKLKGDLRVNISKLDNKLDILTFCFVYFIGGRIDGVYNKEFKEYIEKLTSFFNHEGEDYRKLRDGIKKIYNNNASFNISKNKSDLQNLMLKEKNNEDN